MKWKKNAINYLVDIIDIKQEKYGKLEMLTNILIIMTINSTST